MFPNVFPHMFTLIITYKLFYSCSSVSGTLDLIFLTLTYNNLKTCNSRYTYPAVGLKPKHILT